MRLTTKAGVGREAKKGGIVQRTITHQSYQSKNSYGGQPRVQRSEAQPHKQGGQNGPPL